MNTSTKVNLLQNIPALEGVDSVLLGDVVQKLYSDFTYRILISNYWAFNQLTGSAPKDTQNIDFIPAELTAVVAHECIKGAISLTQALGTFNFEAYLSRISGQDQVAAGQTQRRAG